MRREQLADILRLRITQLFENFEGGGPGVLGFSQVTDSHKIFSKATQGIGFPLTTPCLPMNRKSLSAQINGDKVTLLLVRYLREESHRVPLTPSVANIPSDH